MKQVTRKQVIAKLVEMVDDWDIQTLVEYAQEVYEKDLQELPLNDLQSDAMTFFGENIELIEGKTK